VSGSGRAATAGAPRETHRLRGRPPGLPRTPRPLSSNESDPDIRPPPPPQPPVRFGART